jgi:hypothetical protein
VCVCVFGGEGLPPPQHTHTVGIVGVAIARQADRRDLRLDRQA